MKTKHEVKGYALTFKDHGAERVMIHSFRLLEEDCEKFRASQGLISVTDIISVTITICIEE